MEYEHAHNRAIILPGRRVVFVPMLKAGCTSLLWLLSELAGMSTQRVQQQSTRPSISPWMTIHDLSFWPDRNRWALLSEEERNTITNDSSWLRFTTVRDPSRRVFSAWQSKLMLREPGFARRFRDATWFPRVPTSPDHIVEDFRRFLHSISPTNPDPPIDGHWAPQVDLLENAPNLNFIGRAENMEATHRRLRQHLSNRTRETVVPTVNQSPVPYTPALFDDETAGIVNRRYAADLGRFDYDPIEPRVGDLKAWNDRVMPILTVVGAVINGNERIDALARRASRARRTADRLREELDSLKAKQGIE